MKKEKLIKIFEFLNKKRNKGLPFVWTALNYPDLIPDEKYLEVNDLDLESKKLTRMPEFLLKCKNLEYLELGDNRITKIENLDNLIKLKSLSLFRNRISKIEGLDNLKSLTMLGLSNNSIKKLENLDNLKLLGYLIISDNLISKLEGLDNLKSLYAINIRGLLIGKAELEEFKRNNPKIQVYG